MAPTTSLLLQLPLLAQAEPEGLLRGLIQLLLLLAFFGLPALARRSEKGKPEPRATPRPEPKPARSAAEKSGRDLWKELMQGIEQVGEKVEGKFDEARKAVEEATTGAERPPERSASAPAAGGPKRPARGVGKPASAAPAAPTTQVGPKLDSGLRSIMAEADLESGKAFEQRLEFRGQTEEALERGAAPQRARFEQLPSGLKAQGSGFARVDAAMGSSLAPTANASDSHVRFRLFGRAIDRADLRRSVVLAEVLGRPVGLRAPDQQTGKLPG